MEWSLQVLLTFFIYKGIPLAVFAVVLYLNIRDIPSRLFQCILPISMGIIVFILLISLPVPGIHSGAIYTIIWILLADIKGSFLILPPFILAEKYLQRIPSVIALILLSFMIIPFILCALDIILGDALWNSIEGNIASIMASFTLSAFGCVLILGLDRMLVIINKKPQEGMPRSPAP